MTDPTPDPAPPPLRLDLEALAALQPGLARLMPEIGTRMWKAHHAAAAGNRPLARWQLREMEKLLRICMVTRPKYRHDLQAYIDEDVAPLHRALEAGDLDRFLSLYADAVGSANEYHRRWAKPWIVWRLPESPPPDLDLSPRPAAPAPEGA